jgi:predicted nucleic acid-binding protein
LKLVLLDPGVLVFVLITPQGSPAKLWHAVVHERLEIAVCPRPLI